MKLKIRIHAAVSGDTHIYRISAKSVKRFVTHTEKSINDLYGSASWKSVQRYLLKVFRVEYSVTCSQRVRPSILSSATRTTCGHNHSNPLPSATQPREAAVVPMKSQASVRLALDTDLQRTSTLQSGPTDTGFRSGMHLAYVCNSTAVMSPYSMRPRAQVTLTSQQRSVDSFPPPPGAHYPHLIGD